VVGVPVAGQRAAELQHVPGCERLVGHATSVLPIRAEMVGTRRFADLLADVRQTFLEAREHQGFGCAELIRRLEPPRNAGHLPFVSVTLNLDDEPEMRWDGLAARLDVPPRAFVGHDLEVSATEGPEGLRIACHFAQDLFDGETVSRWIEQWKNLMAGAADVPTQPLESLPIDGGAPAAPSQAASVEPAPAVRADTLERLRHLLDRGELAPAQAGVSAPVAAPAAGPAPVAASAPARSPVTEADDACFYGPAERLRFARHHRPATADARVLTVICPPLFSEYARTWLALRRLAAMLADGGHHVLRFDYLGTGDSFGNPADVSLADWIEDVELAVREGRRRSGCDDVRLVGVRAGALLACRYAAAHPEVRRVVLWDPVVDGATYVESARRVQAATVEGKTRLSPEDRRAALEELRGFRVSAELAGELRSLDGTTYADVGASRLHVVKTSSTGGPVVEQASCDVVRFACRWDVESEDVLTPVPVLERLAKCLLAR
jgi:pimeloyl-ACP methyl ester carboxylesterase